MNVLIVDDSKTNRELLRVLFETEGHKTTEAGDGVEALAILKQDKVDAVISDILMPNMDGYRLSHALRKDERFANLPLIIYSGTYTTASEASLALAFGADKFIAKPCPHQAMLDAVKETTAQNKPRRSSEADIARELAVMKHYSELLISKLEDRSATLESTQSRLLQTQRELRARIEELERTKTELQKRIDGFEKRPTYAWPG